MKKLVVVTGMCLSIVFSASQSVMAQFQGKVYEPFNDAQVKISGVSINAPWCGGINSVQINHADLNHDGKNDLILYDHNSYIIKTFINIGSAGEIKYSYDPTYEKNFPTIYNYLILKDYNCDGIPDLFHKGLPGVAVHKGYYQNNELKFTYYKDLYFPYPSTSSSWVNVFVQPDDIPAIIDVDEDGDLDVVSFGVNGNMLEYTKNMQVESGLPCDSMRMKIVDFCYGKFFQGINRTVNTGYTCSLPLAMSTSVNLSSNKKSRHTGNCFTLLDIEGDGDLDFLGGNIVYSDAQLLLNTGTSDSALYTLQDTIYNSAGHMLNMPSWAAPFHLDIDNDGDGDLLFTSHNENSNSADEHCVAFYKNTGSDLSPTFTYQHDSLFTVDMIDVGSYSYPTFYDFDKDGKKDLFVGGEGSLDNTSGLRHSKLAYFKNTSTVGAVSFELITSDFLGLSVSGYNGIFPAFGDLTGDGKDDLVLGNKGGYIAVYKNYATSNLVMPDLLLSTDSIPSITVGHYSAPLVYDFNQDGKTDLLVGGQSGTLAYYQDTSSTAQKKLALQTVSVGNFKAGDVTNIYGYCVPFIAKMDNTNKEFLMIGNIDGTIARYDNFINNMGTFQRIDSNYSEIKTVARSTPAIADLDGDGIFEMVVGNKLGGLSYFKQVKNVLQGSEDLFLTNSSLELYPNPANTFVHLLFKTDIGNSVVHISFVDLTGHQVLQKTLSSGVNEPINISSLADGVYLAKINIGESTIVKKVIKCVE